MERSSCTLRSSIIVVLSRVVCVYQVNTGTISVSEQFSIFCYVSVGKVSALLILV